MYTVQLHEEEEVMSLFSTDIYTETTPGKAVRDLLISAGVIASIGLIVYWTMPEKPMVLYLDFSGIIIRVLGKENYNFVHEFCYYYIQTLRSYPFDGLRVELGGNPDDPNDLTHTVSERSAF